MKKNVIMVVNPVSGGVNKDHFIDTVKDFASKKNIEVILFMTTGRNDHQKINQLYQELKPERILVAGGDGTIKMVGEALATEEVIIGIIPVGSANGLAAELNLLKTLEENIAIALFNDFIEIDMVLINGRKSLHLSDIGLNAVLIKNYKTSKLHGKLGYALQVFKTLLIAKRNFRIKITRENKTTETKASMVVIANAQKYGTGVVINPLGVINDGKFELVIIKNLSFSVFLKIVMGNMPLNYTDVEIISAHSASIETKIPISFQIDGEYIGKVRKLEISIAPEKMRVAIA